MISLGALPRLRCYHCSRAVLGIWCALKLAMERLEGVNKGDWALGVHPCRALSVAENDETRSPFIR